MDPVPAGDLLQFDATTLVVLAEFFKGRPEHAAPHISGPRREQLAKLVQAQRPARPQEGRLDNMLDLRNLHRRRRDQARRSPAPARSGSGTPAEARR